MDNLKTLCNRAYGNNAPIIWQGFTESMKTQTPLGAMRLRNAFAKRVIAQFI